jgi:hypothetical protein
MRDERLAIYCIFSPGHCAFLRLLQFDIGLSSSELTCCLALRYPGQRLRDSPDTKDELLSLSTLLITTLAAIVTLAVYRNHAA